MKKSTIIYIVILFFTGHTLYTLFASSQEPFETNNEFFKISFLRNPQAVRERLYQDGFEDISFTTSDDYILAGLFLNKSKKTRVKGTIICAPGFHPGLKEGMSTFYALIKDEPYNVLLFDNRGHGESQGTFYSLSGIANYGKKEYIDLIAAIKWIHKYNVTHNIKEPIIILGLCAGAYHATRAAKTLHDENPTLYKSIKGIIFDSGWTRLDDIGTTTIYGELDKRFKNFYAKNIALYPIYYTIALFYYLTFYHSHKKCPNISEDILNLDLPFLFIHGCNDKHVPIENIKPLTQGCLCSDYWWIEESTHACHHLKHQKEYKKRILSFIKKNI